MKRVKSILRLILLVIFLTSIVDIIMFSTNYIPILNRMETSLFDWDIQDIIYSTDNFKNSNIKRDDIMLVNWEHLDRDSIALLIESIKTYSPAVIGVDAIFFELKDSIKDDKLRLALQDCDLVTPIDLKNWSEQKQSFLSATGSHDFFLTPRTTRAFTYFYSYDPMRDIYGTDDESFIRSFSPYQKLKDSTVFCFAFELVKRYNKNIFDKYINKYPLTWNEQVRYWGDTSAFKTIGYKDLINGKCEPTMVKGKIVILTFLGYQYGDWRNSEGKFTTPLNSKIVGRNKQDTYGGVIHANIALSILKDVRVKNTSWLTTNLTNFIIVLLFMLTLDTIRSNKAERLPLYGRLTAYIFALLLVGLSLLLYFEFDTRIDFRLGIVYILALPEIYLVYLNKLIPYFRKMRQKFRDRKASAQSSRRPHRVLHR